MADELEEVVVLRGHLEEVWDVLDSVVGHLQAEDLASAYKQMMQQPRYSRLTIKAQQQQERLSGYLRREDGDV